MRYLVLLLALAGCSAPAQAPDACLEALDAADRVFEAQIKVSRADDVVLDAILPLAKGVTVANLDRMSRALEGKKDALEDYVDVLNDVDYPEKAAQCRNT